MQHIAVSAISGMGLALLCFIICQFKNASRESRCPLTFISKQHPLFQVEQSTNKPVICDLGVGRLVDATHRTSAAGNAGTLAYQHKEQLLGQNPTPAVDVYSFAVIMLEVFTRVPAWQGYSLPRLQRALMEDTFPRFDSEHIPVAAKEILRKCFQSANKRPTFISLLPEVKTLVGDVDIW